MTLEEFCENIEDAKVLEDLWSVCMAFFKTHGISKASYHHYPAPGEHGAGKMRVYAAGMPDNWVREYVEGRLHMVDPLPELAQTATQPFFWRDKLAFDQLGESEKAYMNWMKEQGMADGLAVQVFGPGGRNGLVAMGFEGTRPDLTPAAIRELQCACQIGHMIYIRLSGEEREPTVKLSSREREVLFWVAKGKSNSVIGDIMGISNHTVDAYLRRIYLKLGVSDRISAAIKGIGAGLIMPVLQPS